MKKLWIVLGVIAVIIFMVFNWYQSGYNSMIALNEQVKSSWAQVENQLQRRFDLVPNLVNTVKGYANHEEKIFTEVTKLRSQWGQAATVPEKVDVANQLSAAMGRLLMVSENYPQLKADQGFLELQSQLEGTENRIAVERMRYNQSAQQFNTYRQSFLGRLFAGQTGLNQEAAYFKAEQQAQQTPKVSF